MISRLSQLEDWGLLENVAVNASDRGLFALDPFGSICQLAKIMKFGTHLIGERQCAYSE